MTNESIQTFFILSLGVAIGLVSGSIMNVISKSAIDRLNLKTKPVAAS